MNIINVGDPKTISLLAGQTVSVTTTGTITAECVSGLGLTAGATIGSAHGSKVFGAFTADGVIKLTATVRDGAYEVNIDTSVVMESVADIYGNQVFDPASKGALFATGVQAHPSFYFFGSSSTGRSYDTTLGFGSRSYISRFLRKCGGGVNFAGASGVSGEDSIAQIARLPAVLAALPTPKPTHFVLQIAGNDIVNTNNLNTVTKPNILAMVNLVLAAGMIPVLMSNNTLLSLTADQIIRAATISEYMRTLWRTDSRIRLADVARWTGDTTSASYAPVSGATSTGDNLHPTSIGAFLMGDALYEGVKKDVYGYSRFAALPNLLYDATQNPSGNLIANPFLLGTGGTGGAWVTSGSVPTGMNLNRTAGTGTVAITTVARTDGIAGNWHRFTFTMQAGDTYSIFMQPSDTGLPANTTLYGCSEAQIDTTASSGNVQRASLRIRNAAVTQTIWDGHTSASTGASDIVEPSRSRAEFLFVPPMSVPTVGACSLSHDLAFVGTGTFVLDIAAVGLYVG